MRIILIGYRGTGKSSVARRLSLALACDWIDADVEVELRAGKSIAALFADQGEEAFRELESEVLADVLQRDPLVLATGGGAILRDDNRRRIVEAGQVVWLTADVDTIVERVAEDRSTAARRPQLTTAGGREEIVALLERRRPFYRQCANLEVDTVGKTPDEVAAEIVDRLGLSGMRKEEA